MVFTCVTCSVTFSEAQSQRLHFKTEWHRYNLKRKVAQLPTINAKDFQERSAQHQQAIGNPFGSNSTLRSKINNKDQVDIHHNCCCCHNVFASQTAFDDHLRGKTHLDAIKKHRDRHDKKLVQDHATKNVFIKKRRAQTISVEHLDDSGDDQWSDISDGKENTTGELEEKPLLLEECMFCSHLSDNLEDNLLHMADIHSFFVPDTEYLTDLDGLIGYLDEKVGVGYMCLWCNEQGKAFQSVRAAQQHMRDKGHCKLMFEESNVLQEYCHFYDYSSSYPKEQNGKKHEEVPIDVLDDGGYELELPSGAVIGHRSLMRYYRQSLTSKKLPRKNIRALSTVVAHYRGLGWMGTTRKEAFQKCRAIASMNMRRSKHHMQLGVKNNKLQKHFREQILF